MKSLCSYMVESVATERGWYSYRIEVNRTVVNLHNYAYQRSFTCVAAKYIIRNCESLNITP